MPMYEYACESCGSRFEKLVRRAEDVVDCPDCGDKHLRQEYSTFAARSSGMSQERSGGGCPAGMCRTPGICGRN